jgi:site-specific DNA-methyltransferase (adenine-specific)
MNDFENKLYYGDNLQILKSLNQSHEPFIDLIYIDPPFNSKRNYNILFEDLIQTKENGEKTTALKEAFSDTWSNTSLSHELEEMKSFSDLKLYKFLTGNRDIFSDGQMSYLTMMAHRLYYMHKILKDTGSIYLHCDPTMSHYLKIVMDIIFGVKNFRNEISWKRSQPKSHTKINFPNCRDIILRYAKSDKAIFNKIYGEYNPEYIRKFYKYTDPNGRRYRLGDLTNPNKNRPNLTYEFLGITRVWRWTKERMEKAYKDGIVIQNESGAVPQLKRYLDELKGQPISNSWDDIEHLHGSNIEFLGYPTQKPLALLERIIKASSNEGDIVADFFCGCGTSITVAEKFKRRWLGVDINHLAIGLIEERRLKPLKAKYQLMGFPQDQAQAEKLAREKPFEFEQWVVEYIFKGHCTRKTRDGGFDGHIAFNDGDQKKLCLLEVKGGKCTVKNVREFDNVIQTQKADMGFFICFEKQRTSEMIKHCDKQGYVEMQDNLFSGTIPKLSIITIEDILSKRYLQNLGGLLRNITY